MKARIWHWVHGPGGLISNVLESEKRPLESRIWYTPRSNFTDV